MNEFFRSIQNENKDEGLIQDNFNNDAEMSNNNAGEINQEDIGNKIGSQANLNSQLND